MSKSAKPHAPLGPARPLLSGAALCLLVGLTGCHTARTGRRPDQAHTIAEGYLLNEPAVARSLYEEMVKKNPGDSRARMGLARVAYKLGEYETALTEARRAEQGVPLGPGEKESLEILRGRIAARLGKPALEVWSLLYPVWQRGSIGVKTSLDAELKELAKRIPPTTPGHSQVVGFVAPLRPRRPSHKKPEVVSPKAARDLPVGWRKILPRSAWHPTLAPVPTRLSRMTRPFRITLHHSAHDDVSEGRSQSAAADLIRRIQRYHVRENGWGDIGYHFVIDGSGKIWEARSLKWQGAHAGGVNNRGNIGIVLLGDFEHAYPSAPQTASMQWLVRQLQMKYNIAPNRLYGHCHLRATKCPGRYLRRILVEMNPALGS